MPLFPNLRYLGVFTLEAADDIMGARGHIVRCVPFLAGPQLHSLALAGCVSDWNQLFCTEVVEAQPVLFLLAEQCPDIKQVALDSSASDAYAFLACLTRTEEITLGFSVTAPERERLFAHLAALSSLRSLSLTNEDARTDLDKALLPPLKLAQPAFPSLEYLNLHDFDGDDIVSILDELCGGPMLRHLGTYAVHSGTLDALFAAISALTHLESLTLYWEVFWDHLPRDVHMTSTHATHLHALHNLRILSLYGFTSVSLTDADLAALAAACPCLEELQCTPGETPQPKDWPAVTFVGLAEMRNACPHLRYIVIGVSDMLGPGVSRCTARQPRTLQPLELYVSNGSPSLKIKPKTAALVLRALFPLLSYLDYGAGWMDYGNEVCKELHVMNRLLKDTH